MFERWLAIIPLIAMSPQAQAQETEHPKLIAQYRCAHSAECSISCHTGTETVSLTNLTSGAKVFVYPSAPTVMWLEAGGPNGHYYLGGSFCDFSKMLAPGAPLDIPESSPPQADLPK